MAHKTHIKHFLHCCYHVKTNLSSISIIMAIVANLVTPNIASKHIFYTHKELAINKRTIISGQRVKGRETCVQLLRENFSSNNS